jgi:hypothetical protein
MLENRAGVEVSDVTIWRTLRRTGFTMQKVRYTGSSNSQAESSRLPGMLSNEMKGIGEAIDMITAAHVNPRQQFLSMKVLLIGAP